MALKARWKPWISAIALTALVWTGTVGPAPSASAAARPFSDVSGHWAEKHIVKLALQGIVSGKGEGIFAPNESVRREDAVILALRFLGLADEIGTSGSIAFPSTFEVDDYAKKYVQEAFKRKLLLAEEEYALANQEKGKSWGKTAASREWVTRLLVRAIGKQSEAADNAGKSTAFSDDAKIDGKYKAYVLTAVNQGLVSGVTLTTFEPKSPINRASIAILFSKAESKMNLAFSGQVSGVLLAINEDKLTILHDDGTVKDYTLTSGTLTARYDSDKPSTLAGLKLYGKAILIHDADGAIGYVEQTDDKPYITTIEGTFSKLNTATSSIWLSVGDDFQSYVFDPAHPPIVTDVQGKTIALKDIPVGAIVSLKKDTVRTEGKIVAVSVKQSVVNKTGSGTVVAWNATTGALQVKDVVSGSTEDFTVSPNAALTQEDIPVKREKLKPGDSISYEIKSGSVVSITIAKPVQTSESGKFFDYNKTTKTIQYFVNDKLTAKFVAESPVVKITGLTDATLDDLQKDDAITLTLNDSDKVTLITVTNRSVVLMVGASVAGYVDATKTLSLIDSTGKPKNLYLVANTRYDLNGTLLTEANALPMVRIPGKKLTVGYSGENVVYISIVAKYAGTVVENNLTSKTIKVKVDAANTVTLPYSYPAVEIYGQSSASFSDVKVGDQVTVLLNGNQDQAGTIQVQKTAQLEVVGTDAASLKFRAKKAGSSTIEEWILTSAVALQDENGATLTIGQFAAGSVANVTFMGKTPVKIKSVSVVYGRVSSVDTAAASVEIALANGTTVTKQAGANPLIMRDSTTLASLSAVQPNDRVEIRKDENDRTIIQIVPPLAKQFWQYNSANSTIQVRRSNFTEENVYAIDSQTYIHQGTTVLAPGSLRDGDAISLYILRGKLVEISK